MKSKFANEIMKEEVKPIKQAEADALASWINADNTINMTGSVFVKKFFEQSEKIRRGVFNTVFGPKSPWILERKGNTFIVKYDRTKAVSLGIED